MMPTKHQKIFSIKICSIKYRYLPVIYNRKFFVHDDKEMKWQIAHRFWSIRVRLSKNFLQKSLPEFLVKSNACLPFKEVKEKVTVGITFSFFILMKPV